MVLCAFPLKRLDNVAPTSLCCMLYDDNRVILMLSRGSANIRDVVLCILSTGRLLYMIMTTFKWRQSSIN